MINAQSGHRGNTRRVFNEAGKAGLGRIIVINKMDADNIDFPALVENIQELFGKACVLLNVPLGQGGRFPRRGQHAQGRRPTPQGALVDPAEIHDVAASSRSSRSTRTVMTRYFEGIAAQRRGARPADRPGRGRGHADPDRLRARARRAWA